MKPLPCLALAVGLAAVAPALAHADDRTSVLSVGALFGGQSTGDDGAYMTGGMRATLSFEHAPLPYPDAPGYNVGFSFVPEIIAGAMLDSEHAEGQLGVGARLELRMAQREMGLLKISAHGGVYLGARALVSGDQRIVTGEISLGDYFTLGRTSHTRFGVEANFQFGRNDTMTVGPDSTTGLGAIMQLYVGHAL